MYDKQVKDQIHLKSLGQNCIIVHAMALGFFGQKQISDAASDDHKHDGTELNEAFRKLLANVVRE